MIFCKRKTVWTVNTENHFHGLVSDFILNHINALKVLVQYYKIKNIFNLRLKIQKFRDGLTAVGMDRDLAVAYTHEWQCYTNIYY